MTSIVASLVEGSVRGVSDSSRHAFRHGADIVEVRLDSLRPPRLDCASLSEVREAVRGPAIATLRSSGEGGRSRLGAAAREKALRAAIAAGFDYVDLELRRDQGLLGELRRARRGPDVIASVHFGRPAAAKDIGKALREACRAGDFGKVAMPCEHAGQAIMLAALGMARSEKGDKFTLIGMGDQGQLTRVCAEEMGSAMVYCALRGRLAAPGQLSLESQSALAARGNRYVLGLLGHPVRHSVSKPMQEAALARSGLTGAYLNLDLPPEALTRSALETIGRLGFSGLNVTIPHKQKVHSLCDGLDREAASTGAVNTVVFKRGQIHGKNTDVIGFIEAVERKTRIGPGTEALIVGAGGAARAAAFGLVRAGAHVTVAARDRGKLARMVAEFGAGSLTMEALKGVSRRFDLIVNCTPLGTGGKGVAPVPPTLLKRGVLFFDMVYNPPVTKAMEVASARKAKAASGLDMLVGQGAESFRAWTGAEPDTRAMRAAARRALA